MGSTLPRSVLEGERRLSAVMLTDLVGYTALTQRDEARALEALEQHRTVVRPLLDGHKGREVKTIGDAFLVEFGNALDATRCAIAIQKAFHERPADRGAGAVQLRIGLHVGDVVHQEGDIYGDGVNLVSRVEPLAEPGGICVSGAVYEQVRNKIELPFVALGETSLKNVAYPVPLYRIELPWLTRSPAHLTPWVARPAEEALLGAAVESAAKGHGGAFVLVGASGVGKSRLAEETIQRAERAGFRVLRGRAFPGEVAPPYSHWAEMIRSFVHDGSPSLVQRVAWGVAPELAKIVPEVSERVGPMPPAPAENPEAARARFFEGISQFFVNVSREAPLLLLFDDLQWADPPSIRLLEFVLRTVPENRWLLLATCLEAEDDSESPLTEGLRYLRKNRLLTVVPVRRLDQGAVGEMIQRTFQEPEATSEEFARLVHDRTGGNPFFVEEVLRSLVEVGAIYRTPEGRWERKELGEIAIPKSVRDVVKQRFNHLDEPTKATLRIAAVLGAEFPFDLLREVAEVDEDRLLAQLEHLVETGLLEETTGSHRLLSYSFTDQQLQRVLYDEMISPRRTRHHRKAAEALERIAGPRREEFAGELSFHYREGHDIPKAREYALLSAERWMKVFGFEQAERDYRTVLELLEEAPDDKSRAQTLDGLGRVDFVLGRLPRAVVEWEEAIRLYVATAQPLRAGRLYRDLGDLIRLQPEAAPGRPDLFPTLMDEGERLLGSLPPSRELVILLDLKGVALLEGGSGRDGAALLARATELAHTLGEERLEMEVKGDLAFALPLGEQEQAFQYLQEVERYFSRPGTEDWDGLTALRSNLSFWTLWFRGDPRGAVRWAERALEATERGGNRAMQARTILTRLVRPLVWMGETSRAQHAVDRAVALVPPGPGGPDPRVETAYAQIALLRNDLDAAERHLDVLAKLELGRNLRELAERTRIDLLRERGRFEEAATALRALAHSYDLSVDRSVAENAGPSATYRAQFVETLLDTDRSPDDAEVAKLTQELQQLADGLSNPFAEGLRNRVLGKIALASGNANEAVRLLQTSVQGFRSSENALELARALHLLGGAAEKNGDAPAALAARTEAAQILTKVRG